MIEDLWYKNGIVYCLDVETFMDGNGDGVGDFRGLRRRLDYLAGLGVTCLWLLPIYPTPNRDNGYDVSDYYGVDPRLGDLGDFVEFSHQARMRGLRIILDLVINHTSDQHPWFQQARRDPESPFRNYYIWSRRRPRGASRGVIFAGVQKSTWSYDEEARAWYFHRFFPFQPDLNIANPEVRREILKVMGFWLELGVSGFRVDAVPFIVERTGMERPRPRDPFHFLREMRDFLSWRRGDAVLLAEANVPYGEVLNYFGNGDRMQLVFDFQLNQTLFHALALEDARPLARLLRDAPHLPGTAQWATFLRNHDELDLGGLSPGRRRRVFQAFAPEEDMRLYGRGIRRRLAPMLGGDRARLELAYSLLLTLPGSPVLWYGEELGMGEDLGQPDRQSVRSPMQWASARNAGFTLSDRPIRPALAGGPYGYERVNVVRQRRERDSLLSWMERMIRMRKETPELGWARPRVTRTGSSSVLGLLYERAESAVLVLHNLSRRSHAVTVDPRAGTPVRLIDTLHGNHSLPGPRGGHLLTLEGYGYRWFRLEGHDPEVAMSDSPGP